MCERRVYKAYIYTNIKYECLTGVRKYFKDYLNKAYVPQLEHGYYSLQKTILEKEMESFES